MARPDADERRVKKQHDPGVCLASGRRGRMTRSEPRVHLRGLVAADADLIAAWSRDEEFCQAADWSMLSFEQHRAFQRRLIGSPPDDLVRLGAIQDGHLVGYVDLHGSAPSRRELGFLVGPREVWGQGHGDRLRGVEVWVSRARAQESLGRSAGCKPRLHPHPPQPWHDGNRLGRNRHTPWPAQPLPTVRHRCGVAGNIRICRKPVGARRQLLSRSDT